MKKLALLSLLGLASLSASSQDVIICRNGDEITSKVLKVSKTEVEYKKWSNQDGPTYTLDKSDVFMIKYINGEKDVFKEEPANETAARQEDATEAASAQSSNTPNEPILATPAANNAELIAQYNTPTEYIPADKKSTKKSQTIIGTLGVTSSSILSTNDIEISFKQVTPYSTLSTHSVGDTHQKSSFYSWTRIKYAILIKNKTSRVIYVDKAACFGTSSAGEAKAYYSSQEFTVTEGGNSGTGATVNLGNVADALGVGGAVGTLASGVNVGGDKGKFSAVTTVEKDERFLTIPPRAIVALSEDDQIDHPSKKKTYIVKGAYEYFRIDGSLCGNIAPDQKIEFSEENSPQSMNYMITYSFDKELKECYMINFGTYLKDIFGIRKYIDIVTKIPERIKITPNTIYVSNRWAF